MNELASPGQLRMAFWRWALFIVPLTALLGFASAQIAGTGEDNPWFAALVKPDAQPPGWAFGAAWAVLYVMIGFAVSLVLNARNAPMRWVAVGFWVAQLALNLFWSLYFFGMHQVTSAFYLLLAIFVLAMITTLMFGRIRALAAWLMVPYLAWLCFASILNKQIDTLNPDAETLIVPASQSGGALPPSQSLPPPQ
ncbi:MAG: TspO/MBR family protein [Pseudomonadota bacterium]